MKKWIKILLYCFSGILLIVGIGIGYVYYQYYGKYPIDILKYPHQIGYLSPENRDFSKNFKSCSDKAPIGYYSSARNPFMESKRTFRKFIEQNYKNQNFPDSGFLNLRFIINCKGEIGNMEVNMLNKNLLLAELNKNLVDQLIELTVKRDNWKAPSLEESKDMYMYLTYKIEDGEITEILP
ncbi:MAG: hypothetical protein ACJAU2_001639 [Maribacter sp.]|jgi:hypothetical protein